MPMKDFEGSIAMLCPRCGATELIPDTRDIPYTYKGVSATILAVSGKYCPTCGEGVLNQKPPIFVQGRPAGEHDGRLTQDARPG